MAEGRHRLRDGMCAVWTELMWLKVGTGCGMLRTAGSVKFCEYFDWLRNSASEEGLL